MVAPPGARSLCAEVSGRAAENGIWRADRRLAARPAAGVGGVTACADAARWAGAGRTGAAGLAWTSRGEPQMGVPVLGRGGGARGGGGGGGVPRAGQSRSCAAGGRVGGARW